MTACGIDNLEQTLFLGCSVLDFSCSLGLNEQPTEVTIRLARDTCAAPEGHPKIYYDINSVNINDIRKEWMDPDPGLYCYGPNADEPPTLGACVYFRVADFEFMGILQSWTKTNTRSDQDVYEVKLTSPTEILAGCQLIVGDYSGPIKGFNIFNIYGFQESFGSSIISPSYTDPNAPIDGPIMGTFIGAFGGAGVNDAGMTWNKIKESIPILTSNIVPANLIGYSNFTQNGRICYFGGQSNANFGLIPRDDVNLNIGLTFGLSTNLAYYNIDISEIPNVPDDYRIQGPSIDLLSLIGQICNDFGFDFYIDLLPVKDGGVLRKFIKIRTISRLAQPDLDIVQQFIDATPEVIDSSFGRELRNENATTFIIGGNKHSMWQVEAGVPNPLEDPEEDWLSANFSNETYVRQRIAPFFGINSSGNAYTLYTNANPFESYLNLDINSKYTWKVLGPMLPFQVPVTIGEMRAAEHSYDNWSQYSKFHNTYLRASLVQNGYDVDNTFLSVLLNARIQPRDLTALHAKEMLDQLAAELRIYRQIIADMYTSAKSTLMVRVPWVVSKYEIDSTTVANTVADLHVQRTDDPTDGGWTEAAQILYLANPSVYVDRLRLEDGRVKPFALFDLINNAPDRNGPSVASASTNQFDTDASFAIDRQLVAELDDPGQLLYHSFEQDTELVYLDRFGLISPRVIIRFNNPLDFNNDSNPFFAKDGWKLTQNAQAFAQLQQMAGGIENELLINMAGDAIFYPTAVAIALKSNSYVYGPWKPNNIIESGPPGQIRIEKDDTLVPWTYGSNTNLDLYGQQRANSSVTSMTVGEVGTITVPGWPDVPLGAEIAALRGLTSQFYDQNQHLIENRTAVFSNFTLNDVNGSSTSFTVPSFNYGYWNGSFGPTITSINIEVGESNISTTYSFRTYTPKFGVMTKLNADRLQRQLVKKNHEAVSDRFFRELRGVQNQYRQGLRRLAQIGDARAHKGTPHSVLAGQLVKWDSDITTGTTGIGDGIFRRSIVASKDLFEIQSSMYTTTPSGTGVTSNTDYDSMAIMSWDGLIRPVSITGGGGLPRFYQSNDNDYRNIAQPQPPFYRAVGDFSSYTGTGTGTFSLVSTYDLLINKDYLNPLSNPSGYQHSQIVVNRITGGSVHVGHDIDILARRQLIDFSGDGPSLILPTDSGGFYSLQRSDYADDYRFLAMRGPLVMHGWGYDTNGKPIPNAIDVENNTSGGVFASTGLKDFFLPDFLRKPHTWPVAPVDLRFDRKRGVWTSPNDYRLVEARVLECGSGPSILASMRPTEEFYDNTGGNIPGSSGVIFADDIYNHHYMSGDIVLTYFDSAKDKYTIVGGGRDRYTKFGITKVAGNNPIYNPLVCDGASTFDVLQSPSGPTEVFLYEMDCNNHGDLVIRKTDPFFLMIGGFTNCGTVHAQALVPISGGSLVELISNTEIETGLVHGVDGVQLWMIPIDRQGDARNYGAGGSNSGCCDLLDVPIGDFPGGIVGVQNGMITNIKTIVRGTVKATVVGNQNVVLTNLKLCAGTADPAVAELSVLNTFEERYFKDELVYAIYDDTNGGWYTLCPGGAGFNLLRGNPTANVGSTDDSFQLTNVHPLGEDAPSPGAAFRTVKNINSRAYTTTTEIIAIFDEDLLVAEQIPWRDITPSNEGSSCLVKIVTEIDAASINGAGTIDPANKVVERYIRNAGGNYVIDTSPNGSIIVENRSTEKIDAPPQGKNLVGLAKYSDGAWSLEELYSATTEVKTILIIANVSAASYNAGSTKLTPASSSTNAKIFNRNADNTLTLGPLITLENHFASTLTVSTNQGYLAQAIAIGPNTYKLLSLDCEEVTI